MYSVNPLSKNGNDANVTLPDPWAILESVVSGILGAMGWFRYKHAELYTRLKVVEELMSTHVLESTKDYGHHDTQIAVIQTCQEETKRRLEGIEENTRDTNSKLDTLIRDVLQVLRRDP